MQTNSRILTPPTPGTKQILDERGAEGLIKWIKEQDDVLLTDTTFRDAHQSLLATRVRTSRYVDNRCRIRKTDSRICFPMRCGAERHLMSAYRFLKEDPWDRLLKLREQIPNVFIPNAVPRRQCCRLHELSG